MRWLAGLLLAVFALPAMAQPAPDRPRAYGRFLFIVETSLSMRRCADATAKAIESLLDSDLDGRMQPGDTIGLWTFNDDLYAGRFPLQTWSPATRRAVTRNIVEFIQRQRYEKGAALAKALTTAVPLVRQSESITLVLVTDGAEPLRGTPFDEAVNTTFRELRGQQHRLRMPFVTVLRAEGGTLVNYVVGHPPWPVEIPLLPGEQRSLAAGDKPPPRTPPTEVRPVMPVAKVSVTNRPTAPSPSVTSIVTATKPAPGPVVTRATPEPIKPSQPEPPPATVTPTQTAKLTTAEQSPSPKIAAEKLAPIAAAPTAKPSAETATAETPFTRTQTSEPTVTRPSDSDPKTVESTVAAPPSATSVTEIPPKPSTPADASALAKTDPVTLPTASIAAPPVAEPPPSSEPSDPSDEKPAPPRGSKLAKDISTERPPAVVDASPAPIEPTDAAPRAAAVGPLSAQPVPRNQEAVPAQPTVTAMIEPESPVAPPAGTIAAPEPVMNAAVPAQVGAVLPSQPFLSGHRLLVVGLLFLAVAGVLFFLILRRSRAAGPHASIITQSFDRDRNGPPPDAP